MADQATGALKGCGCLVVAIILLAAFAVSTTAGVVCTAIALAIFAVIDESRIGSNSSRGKAALRCEDKSNFSVECVGESQYQPALQLMVNRSLNEEPAGTCEVTVSHELDNKYDSNAVVVKFGGQVCAYLPRAKAAEYAPRLKALAVAGYVVVCRGRLRSGTEGIIGIWLNLARPDDINLPGNKTAP